MTHRIFECMDAVESLVEMCGFPALDWLKEMINKLHKQMDEIRIYTEKK